MKDRPRIALIGYGRMGRVIHDILRERSWPDPMIIDPGVKDAVSSVEEADLSSVDVCVEFTEPSQATDNILTVLRKDGVVVTGSTGWQDRSEEVRAAAQQSKGAVLHASNFSLGVAVFNAVIAHAAELIGRFPQYDVSLHETHHRGKKDVPSGTAVMLADSIVRMHAGKGRSAMLPEEGPYAEDTLYISAARTGTVFGEHTVTIDSAADQLQFTHRAKTRRGFAEGALTAAQWLAGKQGYYTLEDMLDEIFAS
ncbi:4-hydroxy-tetrahydrodipicolinate reductase [bacterium]|nr:4-hydroxy-tetrahydrodipicolinate reductase [bacterium]